MLLRINGQLTVGNCCPTCGNKDSDNSYNGRICPYCGGWAMNGSYHYCVARDKVYTKDIVEVPRGWQCPLCKKVYAPWVTECNNIAGHENIK